MRYFRKIPIRHARAIILKTLQTKKNAFFSYGNKFFSTILTTARELKKVKINTRNA